MNVAENILKIMEVSAKYNEVVDGLMVEVANVVIEKKLVTQAFNEGVIDIRHYQEENEYLNRVSFEIVNEINQVLFN